VDELVVGEHTDRGLLEYDLIEPALMMVVSMLARITHTTNVYYDIACGENTRASRPDKACRT